jgi:hypothetical protein
MHRNVPFNQELFQLLSKFYISHQLQGLTNNNNEIYDDLNLEPTSALYLTRVFFVLSFPKSTVGDSV